MKKETREKNQEGDIRKMREIVNVVKRGRDGKKGRGEMDREAVGTFTVCSLVTYICSLSEHFLCLTIIRPLVHDVSCCSKPECPEDQTPHTHTQHARMHACTQTQ